MESRERLFTHSALGYVWMVPKGCSRSWSVKPAPSLRAPSGTCYEILPHSAPCPQSRATFSQGSSETRLPTPPLLDPHLPCCSHDNHSHLPTRWQQSRKCLASFTSLSAFQKILSRVHPGTSGEAACWLLQLRYRRTGPAGE